MKAFFVCFPIRFPLRQDLKSVLRACAGGCVLMSIPEAMFGRKGAEAENAGGTRPKKN